MSPITSPLPANLLTIRSRRQVISRGELECQFLMAQEFNHELTDERIAMLCKIAPVMVLQNPRHISAANFVRKHSRSAEINVASALDKSRNKGARRPRFAWHVPVSMSADAGEPLSTMRSDSFVVVTRRGTPAGYTTVETGLCRSQKTWHLDIELGYLFTIDRYRGRGLGLCLQIASQSFLRALYEQIASRLPRSASLSCCVYADYQSVQGERAAKGIWRELSRAQECLFDSHRDGMCALEDIVLDAGY